MWKLIEHKICECDVATFFRSTFMGYAHKKAIFTLSLSGCREWPQNLIIENSHKLSAVATRLLMILPCPSICIFAFMYEIVANLMKWHWMDATTNYYCIDFKNPWSKWHLYGLQKCTTRWARASRAKNRSAGCHLIDLLIAHAFKN